MKVKDVKVGDTLYMVYNNAPYDTACYRSIPVIVGKINTNSIYVHEEEEDYLRRYKRKNNFPLENAMSNFISTDVLTDDSNYANKQNDYIAKNAKLDRDLTDMFNRIQILKLKDKQKVYNELEKLCEGLQ